MRSADRPDLAEALMIAFGDYDSHVDHDFQIIGHGSLPRKAEARRSGPTTDGPQTLRSNVPEGTALLARGEDWAAAMDRAQSAARRRWGHWWVF